MRSLLCVLMFLPSVAWAQALPTITGDFTGDGIADRAELTEPDDLGMAGLDIYIGQPTGNTLLAAGAQSLIWVGGIGQQPLLSITSAGALQVVSMNEAVGRSRWQQTLTIVHQGGQFKLVGFAYDWYDTIDLTIQGQCSINFPSGTGLLIEGQNRTETQFQVAPNDLQIEAWQPSIPVECGSF